MCRELQRQLTSKHIACAKVCNLEIGDDPFHVSTFSSARWAHDNNDVPTGFTLFLLLASVALFRLAFFDVFRLALRRLTLCRLTLCRLACRRTRAGVLGLVLTCSTPHRRYSVHGTLVYDQY